MNIPERSDYIGNPHELVAEHCLYCDALLVERRFTHLHQTIMVCGNPECDDCDPKLRKLAEEAEADNAA
jgi:hypothetical protein